MLEEYMKMFDEKDFSFTFFFDCRFFSQFDKSSNLISAENTSSI